MTGYSKDYTFYPHLYDISDLEEYEFCGFFRDGSVIRKKLVDIDRSFFDSYGLNYEANKYRYDDLIYNLPKSVWDSNINHGTLYGYCYFVYDYDIYMSITPGDIEFFAVNTIETNDIYISGLRVNDDNSSNGYLGERTSYITDFNYNTSTHLYEPVYTYDYFYNKGINFNHGLLFDYTLSNGLEIKYSTVNEYRYYYKSYFDLGNNHNLYLQFGDKSVSNSLEDYNRGYEIGYTNGETNGYGNGYRDGYAEGLEEGGIGPVNFFTMVGGAVRQFTPVMNIEVLPNITLGTVISIPVICTILVVIFKIARG